MKLYYKAGTCSLAARIAIEEWGGAYEAESVDLKTKLTDSGSNYLDVNGKGYVPALVLDDGTILTENAAMLVYISNNKLKHNYHIGDKDLFPYKMIEWLTYIGTELHKQFGVFRNPTADENWKAHALKTLERRLSYIEEHLKGKSFLIGDGFTVADCYFFTVLTWTNFIKLDLNKWPLILKYYKRLEQRPSVISALKKESTIPK